MTKSSTPPKSSVSFLKAMIVTLSVGVAHLRVRGTELDVHRAS